jgi:hypothetical protein
LLGVLVLRSTEEEAVSRVYDIKIYLTWDAFETDFFVFLQKMHGRKKETNAPTAEETEAVTSKV